MDHMFLGNTENYQHRPLGLLEHFRVTLFGRGFRKIKNQVTKQGTIFIHLYVHIHICISKILKGPKVKNKLFLHVKIYYAAQAHCRKRQSKLFSPSSGYRHKFKV
jgi:hypothetical protein